VTGPDSRRALVAAARRLESLGLNVGSAGNLSLRVGDGLLVTPSGVPATDLEPADVVSLSASGEAAPGQLVPTTEWRLHVAVMAARPEVFAVVHTHSPEATAAACLRRPLPAVHYVVARVGGPVVPCADYATYGTEELAVNVLAALGSGAACLMANHGLLTVGASLEAGVALALDVEWLAGVHRRAVALGQPVVLPDDEIERVAERFRIYGQPA
jgi:ribulose-5-phosphate 4-epimerase/fuculose-1-phosphate aldolase